MSFKAVIQPFAIPIDIYHFLASAENQKILQKKIEQEIKQERGNEFIGVEKGKCVSTIEIPRNNFLNDLQRYAASMDKNDLESIYKGTEQSRFNHLIQLHNNIGIYLPVFFFFPFTVVANQNVLPIFVGSTLKLQSELKQINGHLNEGSRISVGKIPDFFKATDEDLEDYEADNEGTAHFWPMFEYVVLEKLVNLSIQNKFPLIVFQ